MIETDTYQPSAAESAADINAWLMKCGLEGVSRDDLLEGYCQRLTDLGIPLMRLHAAQSTIHPHYGSLGFNWHREDGVATYEYAYSADPSDDWLQSPLFHMLDTGQTELRENLAADTGDSRFPILNDLRKQGATDYFAAAQLLQPQPEDVSLDPVSEAPEGLLLSWTSDAPDGFRNADLDMFRATLPLLGLALKSAANRQLATDLLEVYLGREAGQRVLSGEIQRGSLREVDAVLCYFDLKEFTSLSERTAGPDLIAMLNDYFGMAVEVIEAHGGSVLKFLGDGILAMFNLDSLSLSAAAGLDAAADLQAGMRSRNAERGARGDVTTDVTLALHAGPILYGNIGAENRLDFTVIGPAVNLTVRLAGMHRAVGRNIILSDRVAHAAECPRQDVVSLGRYMLRGVSEPCELFTIYQG
ncbi:adenylate/guanylate cyclase [Cribrihabitans marinus]|uniref:Adenylate/guanylate cyclase n=1 Tax=Cribrihabitans marinus TaxID=1227549 RepID=A0A1H7D852_9RHOB|nr:adenylate/guanylate cyclase domain-containing protein [Cribrihabitans marinus]GGH36982.1 adenylate cyclase [Cribrihabitans marinus]SEJ94385.1 adenylate/guanylate cyclase [Cribrihabitans marinus]